MSDSCEQTKPKYDFSRLVGLMEFAESTIHPEESPNEKFIDSGFENIKEFVNDGDKVLDVGCGHGYAMDVFKKYGAEPTGITLHEDDLQKASKHDVRYMNMSFLDFEDGHFDIVWARHCLEHSIMPFLVLTEFQRVLKKGGFMYVEVPAPDTVGINELDSNHYSVFGSRMWEYLMERAGFGIVAAYSTKFEILVTGQQGWTSITHGLSKRLERRFNE